jgi:hypothetical protein
MGRAVYKLIVKGADGKFYEPNAIDTWRCIALSEGNKTKIAMLDAAYSGDGAVTIDGVGSRLSQGPNEAPAYWLKFWVRE